MFPYLIVYPYSNLHELNLDWLIQKVQEIANAYPIDASTNTIEKAIKDDGGNILYWFVANSEGVSVQDAGRSNNLIEFVKDTRFLKNILLFNASVVNSGRVCIAKHAGWNPQIYFLNDTTEDNSQNYNVNNATGCIEQTADGRIQFWAKTDSSSPNIHYRLPVPNDATLQYYDIITSKDDAVVTETLSNVSGASVTYNAVFRKSRHVVTIELTGVGVSNYSSGNFYTICTVPSTYKRAVYEMSHCAMSISGDTAVINLSSQGVLSIGKLSNSSALYRVSIVYLV